MKLSIYRTLLIGCLLAIAGFAYRNDRISNRNSNFIQYQTESFNATYYFNDKNGRLQKERIEFNSGIIKYRTWDSTGYLISNTQYFDKGLTEEQYFHKGSLAKHGYFNKDIPDSLQGFGVSYPQTFSGILEGRYLIYPREGPYKEWYRNGNLKVEGQFKHNEEIGTWKWYNEDGELEELRDYSN